MLLYTPALNGQRADGDEPQHQSQDDNFIYTSPSSQPSRRTAPDSAEDSASKRPRIEE